MICCKRAYYVTGKNEHTQRVLFIIPIQFKRDSLLERMMKKRKVSLNERIFKF
jgi:hypothetical protein